jgi:P27 family predicted phage terminase small subunit
MAKSRRTGKKPRTRGGRKPRPEFKVVEGGPTKPPKLPAKVNGAPNGLPQAGMDLWRSLAPELKRLGLLTPADLGAFAAMCVVWGEAMEAAAAVRSEGQTTVGDKGTLKKHPQMTILNEMLAQFRQWCAEFGLTPAARQRLRVLPEEEISELEEILSG